MSDYDFRSSDDDPKNLISRGYGVIDREAALRLGLKFLRKLNGLDPEDPIYDLDGREIIDE